MKTQVEPFQLWNWKYKVGTCIHWESRSAKCMILCRVWPKLSHRGLIVSSFVFFFLLQQTHFFANNAWMQVLVRISALIGLVWTIGKTTLCIQYIFRQTFDSDFHPLSVLLKSWIWWYWGKIDYEFICYLPTLKISPILHEAHNFHFQ